jgi:hypothetical protein
MTYVYDIVKIVTNLNDNVSTNVLTTDITHDINQSSVRLDSQESKKIKSDSINKINTYLNKKIENPRKRKKASNSETLQKRKINTSKKCSL